MHRHDLTTDNGVFIPRLKSLLEVVNNQWKVNATESGHTSYSKLEYSVGKKYIKLNQFRVYADGSFSNNGVFMFIDKESGACYKPASFKGTCERHSILS